MTMPVSSVPGGSENRECQASPMPTVVAATMKKTHAILLVEDNPADVKITQRAVKDAGLAVQVIVTRDGEDALDYLLHQGRYAEAADWRRPDLVLLDINLPRLSGLEVVSRLRAIPGLCTVPVVVLTTSRHAEDIQRMYAAGANTYIEKPRDFYRFVEALRTIHRYWLDLALLPPPE